MMKFIRDSIVLVVYTITITMLAKHLFTGELQALSVSIADANKVNVTLVNVLLMAVYTILFILMLKILKLDR